MKISGIPNKIRFYEVIGEKLESEAKISELRAKSLAARLKENEKIFKKPSKKNFDKFIMGGFDLTYDDYMKYSNKAQVFYDKAIKIFNKKKALLIFNDNNLLN